MRRFAEALEIPADKITPNTRLVDLPEYDSMGRLALLTMADAKFNAVIDADRMEVCQTVSDLYALIQNKS